MDYNVLEEIYRRYNKREFVSPDPLQFLYKYHNSEDREIVALLAASLAYGRVATILRSIQIILNEMQPSPFSFIVGTAECELRKIFGNFKHRFTTGDDIALLFAGIRAALAEYGSLEECFLTGYSSDDENIIPALDTFCIYLSRFFDKGKSYLLPAPCRGSACKRPMLFLRWMVRKDEVDPGGWGRIPTSKLIIPLDTHMYNIARQAGFTERAGADIKSALEITAAFAKYSPEDPVKYDFALTRFGIRDDMEITDLFKHCSPLG